MKLEDSMIQSEYLFNQDTLVTTFSFDNPDSTSASITTEFTTEVEVVRALDENGRTTSFLPRQNAQDLSEEACKANFSIGLTTLLELITIHHRVCTAFKHFYRGLGE